MIKHLKIVILIVIVGIPAQAKKAPSPDLDVFLASKTFQEGASCLFIGHSFFIPVAKSFDKFARQTGCTNHQMDFVFAGGQSGLPAQLWNNSRNKKAIEEKLASGNIDLLGMTAGGRKEIKLQDYQNWIDLALKYNTNTQFFIGQPWINRGPSRDLEEFNKLIESKGEKVFALVKKLRKAYPNTTIYFINYGKTASVMKAMYEKDKLEDIKQLSGRDNHSLFSDRFIGHAGPMLLDLAALSWLNFIYGTEMVSKQLKYNSKDVTDILNQVIQYNQKYVIK